MNNLTKLTLTLLAACITVPMLLGQAAANRNTSAQSTTVQQEQSKEVAANLVSDVFIIKHRDPYEIAEIIGKLGSESPGAFVEVNVMQEINTITVRDFPINLEAIRNIISKLDLPVPEEKRRIFDVRIDVIWASKKPFSGDPVPPHLSDVISAISNTLSYKHYREGATFMHRLNTNHDDTPGSGTLKDPNNGKTYPFSWRAGVRKMNHETNTLATTFTVNYRYSRIPWSTIFLGDHKKTVFGTTSVGNGGIDMIVVVSGELIY